MNNETPAQEGYDIWMEQLKDATDAYLQAGLDQSDLLMATTDFLTMSVLAQTRNLGPTDRISVQFAIIQRQFNLISDWEHSRPPFDEVTITSTNKEFH